MQHQFGEEDEVQSELLIFNDVTEIRVAADLEKERSKTQYMQSLTTTVTN
jgi:hypothetical protein